MNQGKDICKHLKELRRQIASDNDIDLHIPECTFKGECSGTCPQCDAELQILERELSRRSLLGKAAIVGAAAFTLVVAQPAMAQEPHRPVSQSVAVASAVSPSLKGIVFDANTGDPIPFANVILKQNDTIVCGTRTDFEGSYLFENLEPGNYTLVVHSIGYNWYSSEITILPAKGNKDPVCINVNLSDVGLIRGTLGMVSVETIEDKAIDLGKPIWGQHFDEDQIKHFPAP